MESINPIAHPIVDAHLVHSQNIDEVVENKTTVSGVKPPPMSVSKDENGFIVRRTLVGTAEEYTLAETHIRDLKQKLKKNKTLQRFEEKFNIKLSHMNSESKEKFREDLITRIKTPGGFDKLKDISSNNIR